MEYFAGLDISMNETHICVVDRNDKVALEAKAPSSPGAIAAELAKAPARAAAALELSTIVGLMPSTMTLSNRTATRVPRSR